MLSQKGSCFIKMTYIYPITTVITLNICKPECLIILVPKREPVNIPASTTDPNYWDKRSGQTMLQPEQTLQKAASDLNLRCLLLIQQFLDTSTQFLDWHLHGTIAEYRLEEVIIYFRRMGTCSRENNSIKIVLHLPKRSLF